MVLKDIKFNCHSIMENYSMFRYFKGEEENPYDQVQQNAQYMFWGYETTFEHHFTGSDFSMDSWANPYDENINEWKDVLRKNPVNKADLFKLWLLKLLMDHLPDKYLSNGKMDFLNLYYLSEP
jgi:hypothetical protein